MVFPWLCQFAPAPLGYQLTVRLSVQARRWLRSSAQSKPTPLATADDSITIMTSVSPEQSGVAGAMLQVSLQVGAVIGLSVQAGLLTIHEGTFVNYSNVQASFWFQFGWCLFNLVIFLAFFRAGRAAEGSELHKQMSRQSGAGEAKPAPVAV